MWPHQPFVGRRGDLEGVLCQPEEELASRSRLSPVETEDEFVEVVVEVLVTDSSLMGSEHPSLEQRDRSVDSGQQAFPLLEAVLDLPVVYASARAGRAGLERPADAAEAYARAVVLAPSEAEREFLRGRLAALG